LSLEMRRQRTSAARLQLVEPLAPIPPQRLVIGYSLAEQQKDRPRGGCVLGLQCEQRRKNAETAPARVDFLVERRGFGDSTVALLEDLGYSVLAARNGVEALAQLRKSARIDILFTDVVLP
jgi:PleD family two-component response regulator